MKLRNRLYIILLIYKMLHKKRDTKINGTYNRNDGIKKVTSTNSRDQS